MNKIIKSFFVFLVLFVFISAVNAETKEYNVEGITVTIDDEGVMTFNGVGDIPDIPLYTAPWQDEKDNVVKVIIGEGITGIGNYALYQFYNIEEISLPSTLTSVPKGSALGLYLAGNLKTVKLSSKNKSFVVIKNVLYSKDKKVLYLYPRGKTDSTYNVPEGVEYINAYAIISNKYLKKISLPSTLKTLEPTGIQSIGNLESISINKNNKYYTIENDVLYNKDKTKLVLVMQNKTGKYVMPSSVTEIEKNAFYRCKLSEVIINNKITELPNSAFGYCSNLTNLYIPSSVINIGSYAISYTGLTDLIIPSSVKNLDVAAITSNYYLENIVVLNPNLVIGANSLNRDYNNFELSDGRIINLTSVIKGYSSSTVEDYANNSSRTFEAIDNMLGYAEVSISNQTYTGKPLTPEVEVKYKGVVLKENEDYTLKYTNNTNPGIATVTISAKEGTSYIGSKSVAFTIKKNNPMTVKVKTATVKYKSLKKKNQSVSVKKIFVIKKAKGKVTYSKVSGNKKITISKSGKVTVKKGLKKGKYKVIVNVKSSGDTTYYSKTKKVTITIKVK